MKISLRDQMIGSVGGILLLLSFDSPVRSEDFFDRYQHLGKSIGVEKLTQQERARLSSLIEGVAEISSSGSKNACEDKNKHDCQLIDQKCQSTCSDNYVFDYESGSYRFSTNLGDICMNTCRVVMNACKQ